MKVLSDNIIEFKDGDGGDVYNDGLIMSIEVVENGYILILEDQEFILSKEVLGNSLCVVDKINCLTSFLCFLGTPIIFKKKLAYFPDFSSLSVFLESYTISWNQIAISNFNFFFEVNLKSFTLSNI